jgi:capsid assembly protease
MRSAGNILSLFSGPVLAETEALKANLAPVLGYLEDPRFVAKQMRAFEEKRAAAPAPAAKTSSSGSVAVIKIQGLIMPSDNWISDFMEWSTVEGIVAQINQVRADARIKTVLFDCNTPGGCTDGILEGADAIYQLREAKNTVSISRYTMASAGYWFGCAAAKVVAAPLSSTGSIGVWTAHVDLSGALADSGQKVTIIRAGKYKIEANPYEPLSPEAQAHIQSMVDTTYDAFVGAVAMYRGVSTKEVRNGYGEGRCLLDKEAKAAGLVDAVLSAQTLGARLTSGTRIALAEGIEIAAEDWASLGFGSFEMDADAVCDVMGHMEKKSQEPWLAEADALYLRGLTARL